MAGVFKVVVSGLFAAILASYNEPRGAQDWATRYSELLSQSPIDDDPAVVNLPPYPAAKGVYKHNDKLQSLTKLGEGELLLPEDVQPDPTGTFLYVTNQDGWIRKYYLATAKVENWTYVGGRPLGLALDNAANLIVCEPGQNQLIQVLKAKLTPVDPMHARTPVARGRHLPHTCSIRLLHPLHPWVTL